MSKWIWRCAVLAAAGLGLMLLPASSEAGRGGGGRGGGGGGGARTAGPGAGRGPGGGVSVRVNPNQGRRVIVINAGWGGWGWGGWGWGAGSSFASGYGNSYVYDDVEDGDFVPEYQYDGGPGYGPEADDLGADAARAAVTTLVKVRLPAADATVWFNGARMLARGAVRTFTTPPLEPGKDYNYKVKVRWLENGQPVEQNRILGVRAGESFSLNFTSQGGGKAGKAKGSEEVDP